MANQGEGRQDVVIRIKKARTPYVTLNTTALNDERLSFRACGLHTYLMSKPDNWEVLIAQLEQRSPREGKDAIRTALNELIDAGYLKRERKQSPETGRMAGWESTVYETPGLAEDDAARKDTESVLADVGSTDIGLSDVGSTNVGLSDATYSCIKEVLNLPSLEEERSNSLTTFESYPGAGNEVSTPGFPLPSVATDALLPDAKGQKKKHTPPPISDDDWPGLRDLLVAFNFPLTQLDDNDWWNDLSYTCNAPTLEWLTKEFARMEAWLKENPRKQPTTRWKTFVRGWLERNYEKERKTYASQKR